MTNKEHALELQTEIKTIASQLLRSWGGVDVDSFGWGIKHVDENYVDSELWFGNDYIYAKEEREPGVWVEYTRSIMCVTDLREKECGVYEVTVQVDLPEEYSLPVKYFKCDYLFDELNPLDTTNVYPDALYEVYMYLVERSCHLHPEEVLGKFAKADIVVGY